MLLVYRKMCSVLVFWWEERPGSFLVIKHMQEATVAQSPHSYIQHFLESETSCPYVIV